MTNSFLDVEATTELAPLDDNDTTEQGLEHIVPRHASARTRVRRGVAFGFVFGVFAFVGLCATGRGKQLGQMISVGHIDHSTELYDEASSGLAQDAYGLPGMPPPENAAAKDASTVDDSNEAPTGINDLFTPGAHCNKNEELHLGVCYMNCTLLTQGRYPIRSAPNICCREKPCLTPDQVDSSGVFPGSGYIVGGGGAGTYPHAPGGCAGNEEMHLGLCYKKCALLTDDQYPDRVMANTCCKASPCWNPFNLKTEGNGACDGFGVGGGLTDELKCPHKPQQS